MKHVTLEDLQAVATVTARLDRPLTRRERLERWAQALDERGSESLSTLTGTEFEPPFVRERMETANSALSVAFADPILRADGLAGATYGAARQYFDLSDWQLHEVVCHCHLGSTMAASAAARRVRSLIDGPRQPTFVGRLRHLLG